MNYEPRYNVRGEGERAIQLSFGLRLYDGRIVEWETDEAVGILSSPARIASEPQVWLTAKARRQTPYFRHSAAKRRIASAGARGSRGVSPSQVQRCSSGLPSQQRLSYVGVVLELSDNDVLAPLSGDGVRGSRRQPDAPRRRSAQLRCRGRQSRDLHSPQARRPHNGPSAASTSSRPTAEHPAEHEAAGPE